MSINKRNLHLHHQLWKAVYVFVISKHSVLSADKLPLKIFII